jgi:hypothetical protein
MSKCIHRYSTIITSDKATCLKCGKRTSLKELEKDKMTDKERTIFEKGFEEGYRIARRNYGVLPIGYSKWLEHGEKHSYIKHYNRTLLEGCIYII